MAFAILGEPLVGGLARGGHEDKRFVAKIPAWCKPGRNNPTKRNLVITTHQDYTKTMLVKRHRGFCRLVGLFGFLLWGTFGEAVEKTTPPRAIERPTPEYPPILRAQRIVGSAEILLTIDETGIPTKLAVEFATQPEFGKAAMDAVAQWKFTPATRGGKTMALRISAPVDFVFSDEEIEQMELGRPKPLLPAGPEIVPAEAIERMPVLTNDVKPVFPVTMRNKRTTGETWVALIVDENGDPKDVHTVLTTHLEYAEAALAAIKRWKFKPGIQQGRVVRTEMRVIMNFTPDSPDTAGPRVRPGVARYNKDRDEKKHMEAGANSIGFIPPKPISQEPPYYPRVLNGTSGRAEVDFVVNEYGVVTHASCSSASHPYFAVAAERAVSEWVFKPGTKDGIPVRVHAKQLIEFDHRQIR